MVSILHDLDHIGTLIRKHGVKLVVVDPLMAAINSKLDSHKDHDIHQVLAPVRAPAQETGAVFVFVRHLNKSDSANALLADGGSIAIVGAARSALFVAKDVNEQHRRVLAIEKSNLANPAPSLGFSAEESECGSIVGAWHGEVAVNANDLLAASRAIDDVSRLDEAKGFLRALLMEDGSSYIPANEIAVVARENGISHRTPIRAKADLEIKRDRWELSDGTMWLWLRPVGL